MNIWFATGNINKRKELAQILSGAFRPPKAEKNALELFIPADAGLAFNPEETGVTFLENALLKAKALYKLLEEKQPSLYKRGDPVIADDSGICVDILDGRPGIYSARYCGPGKTHDSGKKITQEEMNALLLGEMEGNPRRNARFVCAMVLYYNPNRFYIAQETMEGELVKNPEAIRGEGGFGYDPILYIPEFNRTVAELSEEQKNCASHRGKAGRALASILNSFHE